MDNLNNKDSKKSSLPFGWRKMADMIAPTYLKKYEGKVNYSEACEMVKEYFPNPKDQELIFEYMKKYFKDEFPEYQK